VPASVSLDVFILSCNRAEMLHETLQSFARQSYQEFRLIVLDNASTDHTEAVVSTFSKTRQVELYRHLSNIGGIDNLFYVQKIATSDWVMIFHDDDLLHPLYIECALSTLLDNPDCWLISCDFEGTRTPSLSDLENRQITQEKWILKTTKHLAAFCFTLNKIHFGATIYKKSAFCRLNKTDFLCFGKILDRPVLLSSLPDGYKAIVFKFKFAQYRIHESQDSQKSNSGPFLKEAIALTKCYRNILGTRWETSSGRCFLINNRSYLKGLYKWCTDRFEMGFYRFVFESMKAGASTWFVYIPRPIARLFKKVCLKFDPDFF
jgi:glycosyltransferase involved in cell wall biosynthesis